MGLRSFASYVIWTQRGSHPLQPQTDPRGRGSRRLGAVAAAAFFDDIVRLASYSSAGTDGFEVENMCRPDGVFGERLVTLEEIFSSYGDIYD